MPVAFALIYGYVKRGIGYVPTVAAVGTAVVAARLGEIRRRFAR